MEIVVGAILEECRKLARELVPAKEFQRAKDHMIGNLILSLETSDELASFYGGQEIMTKKIVSPETVIARLKAVTPAAVREVAREVLRNDHLNFAVVGPYKDKKMFQRIMKI